LLLYQRRLTNYDIIEAGKNIKHFRGCFMKDELPAVPWTNECGILNLNNSNQSGSHDKKKVYFDSYGDSIPIKEIVNDLGKDSLYYTTEQLQNYTDPPICGHLCLDFIKNYNL